jgi:hypothetical protein
MPTMKALVLALAGLVLATPAGAETLRLKVGEPLARFDNLRAGVHRYMRYTIAPDGSRKAIDIWQRTVAFEGPAPGQPNALHIVQRWDEVDGKVLIQDSWFDARTFKQRTHIRHTVIDGKENFGGYRFTDAQVVGMTDLANNSRKDFVMPLPEPSYNFEYDMEFLQTLPLAAGRTFNIPFYDAGVDKPGRYDFVVAGSATMPGPDGRPIDCWLVTADYNSGKTASRFWFAKSGQVLIREEAPREGGITLVKTLLPPESADGGPGAGHV